MKTDTTNRALQSDMILDTCAIMDIASINDLEELALLSPDAGTVEIFTSPRIRTKLRRLGWAYLFFWQLRRANLRVGCYLDEIEFVVNGAGAPEQDTFGVIFRELFVWYFLEEVMCPWQIHTLADIPPGIRGTKADDALIELASRHEQLFVTQEGWIEDGTFKNRGTRRKCKELNVKYMSTREYVEAHCSWIRELRSELLRDYGAGMDAYLSGKEDESNRRYALTGVLTLLTHATSDRFLYERDTAQI